MQLALCISLTIDAGMCQRLTQQHVVHKSGSLVMCCPAVQLHLVGSHFACTFNPRSPEGCACQCCACLAVHAHRLHMPWAGVSNSMHSEQPEAGLQLLLAGAGLQ